MADRARMGCVGCGFMAQKVHQPNIMSLDGCELVALAEVRPQLGVRTGEPFRSPGTDAANDVRLLEGICRRHVTGKFRPCLQVAEGPARHFALGIDSALVTPQA